MDLSIAEFHNIEDFTDTPTGKLLQRFPKPVREHPETNALAHLVMTKSAGAEIRFVTDAPRVRLCLSALESDSRIYVFRGDFIHAEHIVPAGKTKWLLLESPVAFSYFTENRFAKSRFAPTVWRIWLGRESVVFGGLDTLGFPVRPPSPEEKPATRWLAYGSSLTMGANSFFQPGCYTEQTARQLGIDVLNLGMGGSCHFEPHLADYFANRKDWDFATLRAGCNMIGTYEPEEYKRRLEYFLQTLTAQTPHRPIAVIGLSTDLLHFAKEHKIWQHHTLAYCKINEDLAARFPSVHFWEKNDLMPDHLLYTTDFIHPDDAGHSQIATNLATKLRNSGIAPASRLPEKNEKHSS